MVVSAEPVSAAFIVTTGAGTAVVTADRSATFDLVITGTDLTNYTEDGLRIAVNDIAFTGFDPSGGNGGFSGGFHYPSGGANGATLITTTDAVEYVALEFNVGTGFNSGASFYRYEARDDGVVIGTGAFSVTPGTVLGFRNEEGGFDQLFVGSYNSLADAQSATNGSFQAVALDNLRVQLDGGGTVVASPAPPTLIMACGAFGVLGCSWLRRRLVG